MARKKKKKRKKNNLKIHLEKNSTELINVNRQIAILRETKRKIYEYHQLYYHEEQNQIDIKHYYQSETRLNPNEGSLFYKFNVLLDKTHKNRIPYFISKDLYLYTWVDLHPDGTVKNIYSGEKRDPESLIMQDHEIIRQKYNEFQQYLHNVNRKKFKELKGLQAIEWKFKVNTEHIVPQSWFSSLEPMKGDLHHLFVCEPDCNIARSNFAYEDFTFYQPESPVEPIHNQCGFTTNGRFEPEYGKGAAARAMLYFLLRYPQAIKRSYRIQIDIPLLVRWHQDFQVTLYEKHRNQAIYRIQGNRNPFVDFPDLVDRINFPIH
ncbi:MAG: endonuclease [Bacillus sp. (in: Bacteria)]|nr:endonuclease [Bacillus sp. (in: firmicutes)]